jgi:hypothetical protein
MLKLSHSFGETSVHKKIKKPNRPLGYRKKLRLSYGNGDIIQFLHWCNTWRLKRRLKLQCFVVPGRVVHNLPFFVNDSQILAKEMKEKSEKSANLLAK